MPAFFKCAMRWRATRPVGAGCLLALVFVVYLLRVKPRSSYADHLLAVARSTRANEHEGGAATPRPIAWDAPVAPPAKPVRILVWTSVYGSVFDEDLLRDSPVPEWCRLTARRDSLHKADAVVFSAIGGDFDDADVPLSRRARQLWVMFTLEAPAYEFDDYKWRALSRLQLNRTMTYHLDSDYPSPYGYARRATKRRLTDASITEMVVRKSKLIAWMVSNCFTLSGRESIVGQLQRFLPVDTYGDCGNLSCEKDQVKHEEPCYQQLGQQYKFYLSFENALCDGYISEKFTNALAFGMVPIVFGGGVYSHILPHPKSFIRAADFDSVQSLAKYLTFLDGNDAAYAEYFEWRRHYEINIRRGYGGFGRLCNALASSDGRHGRSSYGDIQKWWFEKSHCVDTAPTMTS